jgi:hypothetical protein
MAQVMALAAEAAEAAEAAGAPSDTPGTDEEDR